jgi:hypothetical protein
MIRHMHAPSWPAGPQYRLGVITRRAIECHRILFAVFPAWRLDHELDLGAGHDVVVDAGSRERLAMTQQMFRSIGERGAIRANEKTAIR